MDPPHSDHDTSAHAAVLQDIVREATSLPAEERMPFIKRACAGDDLLLAQTMERLRRSNPEWWEQSIEARIFEPSDYSYERAGELIGPYRIVRTLGHGGMGEVVLAERDDQQFRQQVAIKLLKRGGVSKTLQGRLKVERQILATLNHPNIARLLDGGTVADGTPYIVMEYIDGEPIDIYCNRHKLNVEARLNLFRTICAAVHCAHQHLVVHRDLKPSNILVTGDGTLKLLDFGIAKLLDDQNMIGTLAVTQADVRVMTPEYASPEQIRGEALTTASDVYALGVLLYVLLTGQKPYDIRSPRLSEMERVICEQPSLPLDAWLTASRNHTDSEINRICELRSATANRLRRQFQSDLKIIVATAMHKEAGRRYSSVEQFSADIGRYLDGMPITARKDSWRYRTEKFLRRHAAAVGVASFVIVALIAFAITTTVQARRIAREKARAAEVSAFLVDMFEQADPSHSRGKDITVREMLDTSSRKISNELAEQSDTRANLLATVGKVYSDLGLNNDAEKLLRESLAIRTKLFGPEHPETADAMRRLGDALVTNGSSSSEVESMLEKALAINRRTYGDTSAEYAASLYSLGRLRYRQQRLDDAEDLYRSSLKIVETSGARSDASNGANLSLSSQPQAAAILNSWAIVLGEKVDYRGAENLYRRALALNQQMLGRDHPVTAFSLQNLASVLQKQQRLSEAEPLYAESLAIYKKIFGPEHPETVGALANFGGFLQLKRDFDGAEKIFRDVLALRQKIYGETHSSVGYDHVNLGLLLYDKQQYAEAESEFRKALAIYSKSIAPNHLYNGSAHRSLAVTLIALNRNKEAEQELHAALKIFRATLPESNPQIAATKAALGKALLEQKRLTEAEPLLLDSYRSMLQILNADHPVVVRTRQWITDLYEARGTPQQAQAFFASAQSPAK